MRKDKRMIHVSSFRPPRPYTGYTFPGYLAEFESLAPLSSYKPAVGHCRFYMERAVQRKFPNCTKMAMWTYTYTIHLPPPSSLGRAVQVHAQAGDIIMLWWATWHVCRLNLYLPRFRIYSLKNSNDWSIKIHLSWFLWNAWISPELKQ